MVLDGAHVTDLSGSHSPPPDTTTWAANARAACRLGTTGGFFAPAAILC
jgi:hypothetical protein